MLNETKQHFFKKLIDDTFGYYRIYDFVKIRVKEAINSSMTFTTSGDFWKAILQKEFRENHNIATLQNNQIIKLKDFFLTEWTPKLPGRVWTTEGNTNLFEGILDVVGQVDIYDKVYSVLGPEGKSKMITGGFGSVRVKPRVNNDYCMLLNAVSTTDWHCDFGIPIVVSKSVYDEFLRYSHNEGAPWIEELSGTLFLNNSIDELQLITPAIGAALSIENRDLLSDSPNLQKCYIYVSSPLDLKIRYNTSHPQAVAWTMFRTDITEEPLRLTYAKFNPKEEDSAKEAVEFINKYVLNFGGTEILTDFDGQKRRLISKANLSNTSYLHREHKQTMATINRWVLRESKQNNMST